MRSAVKPGHPRKLLSDDGLGSAMNARHCRSTVIALAHHVLGVKTQLPQSREDSVRQRTSIQIADLDKGQKLLFDLPLVDESDAQ